MESPTRRKSAKRKAKRGVYPLDITGLAKLLKDAKRTTGIRSKAQLLRLAIARGLPILEAQLSSHVPVKPTDKAGTVTNG